MDGEWRRQRAKGKEKATSGTQTMKPWPAMMTADLRMGPFLGGKQ